jgi:hypothetical protein
MTARRWLARAVDLLDENWQRHANPWSVWTRFAAIPALILAVWSRTWIGWWAVVPLAAVALWLWVNPRAFAPVEVPRSWAARGIFGERLWLRESERVPSDLRTALRLLILPGLLGVALLFWGLWWLDVWPTLAGAGLVVAAQLWRIDRLGRLYQRTAAAPDRRATRPSATPSLQDR